MCDEQKGQALILNISYAEWNPHCEFLGKYQNLISEYKSSS